MALSWTNPADPDFSGVIILRKTGGFPDSPADAGATTVYDEAGTSYLDTDVVVDTTYYYAAWSVNTSGEYSQYPARAVKSVAAFTETIRKRCFYLIGGSSSTADPFGNLVAGVDAFDPLTDTVYHDVTTLPVPRYSCAVASAHGKIFVFGGLDATRTLVSTVDVLDVLSPTWPANVWTTATDMPLPRYALRAENVDDKIYVFGGSTSLSPWPWASMVDFNHRFDPISYGWDHRRSRGAETFAELHEFLQRRVFREPHLWRRTILEPVEFLQVCLLSTISTGIIPGRSMTRMSFGTGCPRGRSLSQGPVGEYRPLRVFHHGRLHRSPAHRMSP